jgi:hypothetical protein
MDFVYIPNASWEGRRIGVGFHNWKRASKVMSYAVLVQYYYYGKYSLRVMLTCTFLHTHNYIAHALIFKFAILRFVHLIGLRKATVLNCHVFRYPMRSLLDINP